MPDHHYYTMQYKSWPISGNFYLPQESTVWAILLYEVEDWRMKQYDM